MDNAIRRLDDVVMSLGRTCEVIDKEIKILADFEKTYNTANKKEIKKIRNCMLMVEKYFNEKQTNIAKEIESIKMVNGA